MRRALGKGAASLRIQNGFSGTEPEKSKLRNAASTGAYPSLRAEWRDESLLEYGDAGNRLGPDGAPNYGFQRGAERDQNMLMRRARDPWTPQ
jgi:hypothetical protein